MKTAVPVFSIIFAPNQTTLQFGTMITKLCTFVILHGLAVASPVKVKNKCSQWSSLAPIPMFPRQEHTTLHLPPSTIAILGGCVPEATLSPPINTTNLMQFYSIAADSWTTKAPLPRSLNHVNAAVVDGKIYVLGGLAESGGEERTWSAVSDSWIYDPSTDSWSELPGLPENQARGSAAVGVYGSKIFLMGGLAELNLGGSQKTVATVSIFDTSTRSWIDVPELAKTLPRGRDHAGVGVVGQKMFVLGGRVNGQDNTRDDVFMLELSDVKAGWSTMLGKMPTSRGGVASSVVETVIYIFGGEGNPAAKSGVFDQIEEFDTYRGTWRTAGTMRIPRHGTSAVAVDGKIFLPGGGVAQSGSPVVDFDVFDPCR